MDQWSQIGPKIWTVYLIIYTSRFKKMHMNCYSAWTSSHIQKTKILPHTREVPDFELTNVGRVLILECEVTKNQKVNRIRSNRPRTELTINRETKQYGSALCNQWRLLPNSVSQSQWNSLRQNRVISINAHFTLQILHIANKYCTLQINIFILSLQIILIQ